MRNTGCDQKKRNITLLFWNNSFEDPLGVAPTGLLVPHFKIVSVKKENKLHKKALLGLPRVLS